MTLAGQQGTRPSPPCAFPWVSSALLHPKAPTCSSHRGHSLPVPSRQVLSESRARLAAFYVGTEDLNSGSHDFYNKHSYPSRPSVCQENYWLHHFHPLPNNHLSTGAQSSKIMVILCSEFLLYFALYSFKILGFASACFMTALPTLLTLP